VVRFQGPRANGMPELHQLTPLLTVLQDRGQRVALLTDGRMSGASGRVPAAIHVTPEAAAGGPLARVRDGDIIRLDANTGTLAVEVDAATWSAREPSPYDPTVAASGTGRELFALFRAAAGPAELGASVFGALHAAVPDREPPSSSAMDESVNRTDREASR
jgi:phosphogluconate dehydratase